jgi:hypothetical protein
MPQTSRSRGLSVRGRLTVLAVAVGVLAACGGSSGASTPSSNTGGTSADGATGTTAGSVPLVGRWMQVHTCDQLVAGLEDAGLGATEPAMVGDFFPGVSVDELAAKEDLCSGAKPQRHFHFFDAAGSFGSIDQHGQQVDDGQYAIEGDQLHINDGVWTFTISGDQLTLEPMIDDAQLQAALADPREFSTAGWMVAVAYPGSTWQRVPCKGWC